MQWNTTRFPVDILRGHTVLPVSTIKYEPSDIPIVVKEVYTEGKRWYLYNDELYPSITTLIGATDTEGRAALAKWRENIGHANAAAITMKAAARGTQWHKFAEDYITGVPTWSSFTMPGELRYGAAMAAVMNQYIARVVASEARVISTKYGVAGRLDIGAELHDGRYAIVDFKCGKKEKDGNRLASAAIQGTFYADALAEWMSHPVDTIVIVQLLPQEILWQETTPVLWRETLTERVTSYAKIITEQMAQFA